MAPLRLWAAPVLRIAVRARDCHARELRTRRLPLVGRRLSAVAVLTGLALLVTAVPASAQALTWSLVPSPSRGSSDTLAGVSCISPAACTAVGTYDTSSGGGGTLIESWNGTRWSVVPSPSPGSGDALSGVSCISAEACTAVGDLIDQPPPKCGVGFDGSATEGEKSHPVTADASGNARRATGPGNESETNLGECGGEVRAGDDVRGKGRQLHA